ncbi:hypothetical protein [Geminocystis sp. GBBB08]|uniref:hypothetical protein n=1 Tax=Geminocystis sp. GBBB08 TaxID=2604140 RepID=UPI0027E2535B|nr:hypothetical protein [Geminocystis sp. GBBB08]MBL1209115.1 hypothetical protein [Geminocystis sp. GBBB08]
MKQEYDFSNAEQGKFYHLNSKFNLPIYLDSDVEEFITNLADKKNVDISVLVNEWLRNNINFVKTIDI